MQLARNLRRDRFPSESFDPDRVACVVSFEMVHSWREPFEELPLFELPGDHVAGRRAIHGMVRLDS